MDIFGVRRQKGWQAFAKQKGGEYLGDHMMVRYKHKKWNVVLEVYEEETRGGQLGQFSSDTIFSNTKVYTQFRSYVVNQEDFFFKARPRQLIDQVLNWFGTRSLKFRNSDFRKSVHITASDQVQGRELFLEPDLQKMLLRYSRYQLILESLKEEREQWAFGRTGAKLVFRMKSVIHNPAALEKHHLMFVKMLDRLSELELIGPERPVPTMIERKQRRR